MVTSVTVAMVTSIAMVTSLVQQPSLVNVLEQRGRTELIDASPVIHGLVTWTMMREREGERERERDRQTDRERSGIHSFMTGHVAVV